MYTNSEKNEYRLNRFALRVENVDIRTASHMSSVVILCIYVCKMTSNSEANWNCIRADCLFLITKKWSTFGKVCQFYGFRLTTSSNSGNNERTVPVSSEVLCNRQHRQHTQQTRTQLYRLLQTFSKFVHIFTEQFNASL